MENVYQVQFSFYESFKELRVLFKIVSEWQNITILIFVIFWYPEFTFHHHHLPLALDQDIRYSPKMNKEKYQKNLVRLGIWYNTIMSLFFPGRLLQIEQKSRSRLLNRRILVKFSNSQNPKVPQNHSTNQPAVKKRSFLTFLQHFGTNQLLHYLMMQRNIYAHTTAWDSVLMSDHIF